MRPARRTVADRGTPVRIFERFELGSYRSIRKGHFSSLDGEPEPFYQLLLAGGLKVFSPVRTSLLESFYDRIADPGRVDECVFVSCCLDNPFLGYVPRCLESFEPADGEFVIEGDAHGPVNGLCKVPPPYDGFIL